MKFGSGGNVAKPRRQLAWRAREPPNPRRRLPVAEQAVIDRWGEDILWPGKVNMGACGTCRTTRLWLLTQKAQASLHFATSSKASDARLANRPTELRQELHALIAEYGPEAATRAEVSHIEEFIHA